MRELAVVISNDNEGVTPLDTINAIKDAGFKNVFLQWYNKKWDYSQEEQLEKVRQMGLNVIFAHLGYQGINSIWEDGEAGDKLVERYVNDINICKTNNIPMVIMHLTSKSTAPQYSEIGLKRIRKIVEHAKIKDIKIAFENTKIEGYLEYVLENIKDEHVGICYDSGHCHAHFDGKFNFELFKNRILAVHLHDNDKTDDLHLMPFDGTIRWEELVNNLKDCNYSGPITLELCYRNDCKNQGLLSVYKKGYEVGEKIARMFECR